MVDGWEKLQHWLKGSLVHREMTWPLSFQVQFCELHRCFLPKGTAGRGHRAISRNGRVLLCSDRSLTELASHTVTMRLQTWHRAILPGEGPAPHGVLLDVRSEGNAPGSAPWTTCVESWDDGLAELALDLGGQRVLVFARTSEEG